MKKLATAAKKTQGTRTPEENLKQHLEVVAMIKGRIIAKWQREGVPEHIQKLAEERKRKEVG